MKTFLFLSILPAHQSAENTYLLSSYLLKAYLEKYYHGSQEMSIGVLTFSSSDDESTICDKIVEVNPDYIGYSTYLWNIEIILKVVKMVSGKISPIHILGGPEISFNRVQKLSNPAIADYYVLGEGERKLLDLLNYVQEKSEGSSANLPKGIICSEDDKLQYEEDTSFIQNLDEIPSIYLNSALEKRKYKGKTAFLETQRGCMWKCKYCLYSKTLPTLSYYSLQRIFEELDYLICEVKIKYLRTFDAMFTFNLERSKNILNHLIEIKNRSDVRLPLIFLEYNYQTVDEEFSKLLSALKYRDTIDNLNNLTPIDCLQRDDMMISGNRDLDEGGFFRDYTVVSSVGVQSFCKEALKAVGRPINNIKLFSKFMDIARTYNNLLKIDVMLGLPFETFDSYFKGLDFLVPLFQNTDHLLNIHPLQVLPGSVLAEESEKYGLQYYREGEHYTFETSSFPKDELAYATKLSGVLFRVVNSPLRGRFMEEKERSGDSVLELLERIYASYKSCEEFKETKLIQTAYLDERYWNVEIYRDLSSQWLLNFFQAV